MKNLLKEIIKLIKFTWEHRDQVTWCYCPVCNNELCSSHSFIKDTDRVYFLCSRCGSRSIWNFDIAPGPILEKFQPLAKKYINYLYG